MPGEEKPSEEAEILVYPSLQNPGFEVNSDGRPAGWVCEGIPVYHTEPEWARTGSGSVCVSSRHTYYQDVAAIPGIGHCIVAYVRGTKGGEVGITSEWFFAGPDYALTADSFAVEADQSSVRVQLSALGIGEWVEFDDIVLLDEFLDSPGFEGETDRWDLNGSAAVVEDSSGSFEGNRYLALSRGSAASQKVAINAGDKVYFLSGVHRGATASMEVTWYDSAGNELRSDVQPLQEQDDWTPFERRLVPPPDNGPTYYGSLKDEPVFAEIRPVSTDGAALFDALHLGWVVVVPSKISPDGDGYRDTTEFTFALDEPSVFDFAIRSSTGGVVLEATGENGRLGSNTVEWDGRGDDGAAVSPGLYLLRVEAKTVSGELRTLEAAVEVFPGDPFPPIEEDLDDFFPRGVWVNTGVFEVPDDGYWDNIFGELAEEGFNTVYVSAYRGDLSPNPVFETARKYGLHLIFGPGILYGLIYSRAGYADVSPETAESVFLDLWKTIEDPSGLIGYQILDEPLPSQLPLVEVYSRTVARLSPKTPPITVISFPDDRRETQDFLRSPVFLHDFYPTRRATRVGDFGDWFTEHLLTARATADRYGIPLWLMLPHFTDSRYRRPTPEEARCMAYQALAAGAKGIFYFKGNTSIGAAGGIGTGLVNSRETISYPVYRELNTALKRLEPLLLDWRPSGLVLDVTAPHVARPFEDAGGKQYMVVVNADCIREREITVRIASPKFQSAPDVAPASRRQPTPGFPPTTAGMTRYGARWAAAPASRRPLQPDFQSVRDVLTGETWPLLVDGDATVLKLSMAPGEGRVVELRYEPAAGSSTIQTPAYTPPTVVSPSVSFLTDLAIERIQVTGNRGTVLGAVRPGNSNLDLWLIDLTDPLNPQLGAKLAGYQPGGSVFVGDRLFLSDRSAGLVVLDVADLLHPIEITRVTGVTGNASDVEWDSPQRVFVAAQQSGVRIFDVSDPQDLVPVGETEDPAQADEICRVGEDLLFTFGLTGSSAAFRITPPYTLERLTTFPSLNHVLDSLVYGDTVYAAARDNGLVIIDASVTPPRIAGVIDTVEALSLAQYGRTLFLADGAGGIRTFDLGYPLHPIPTGRFTHEERGIVSAVAVAGDYLLVGSPTGGVHEIPLQKIRTHPMLWLY